MEAAVVSAAEGGLRILLGKLGNILMEKYTLVSHVRKEIQYLKDELEGMNALLRDLAKHEEDHEEQVKTWMKQVREIAYDAEDCVDDFIDRITDQANQSGFRGFLRKAYRTVLSLKARLDVASNIQEIKARAQEVSERRTRYKLDAIAKDSASAALEASSIFLDSNVQLPALFTDESQLVGIEEPRDHLLGFVLDTTKVNKGVLAIVGFGGLGKTTLAHAIYRSPKTQGSAFQCRAFVTVSQRVDVKTLLQTILKEIVKKAARSAAAGGTAAAPEGGKASQGQQVEDHPLIKEMDRMNEHAMITAIHQQLKGKRYLIVLDDLWDLSFWERINLAFPESNNGSRIIITTRDQTIAMTCCSHPEQDLLHEMKHLPEDDCRKLLFKRVFHSDTLPEIYADLKEASDKILRKCNGLPLAIVSIGGLLATNPRKTSAEWMNVHEKLGSELETNAALKLMKQVLTLSYNNLPYHLKACFLYLSIYTEDRMIRRGSVIRKWMAEGFIGRIRKMTMEEVAESYFREFVNRSIVLPSQVDITGKVQSCKVHDIMLEVIVSKSIQENFVSILSSDSQDVVIFQDKVRRLSIHSCDEKTKALAKPSITNVRSLTVLDRSKSSLVELSALTRLRVLDVEGWEGLSNQVLVDICKLFRLRYLSIRSTSVSELPPQIGNLQNLETLDLRETKINKLPPQIGKLIYLRYLLMGSYFFYSRSHSVKSMSYTSAVEVPPNVGGMKALRTLSHVDATSNNSAVLEKIGELESIAKLSIYLGDKNGVTRFFNSLEKIGRTLRYLAIYQMKLQPLLDLAALKSPPLYLRSLTLEGPLGKIPTWFGMLHNLMKASFISTEVNNDLMLAMGSIRSLLSLSLHYCKFQESTVSVNEGIEPEDNDTVRAAEDSMNGSESEETYEDEADEGDGEADEDDGGIQTAGGADTGTEITFRKDTGFKNLKQLVVHDLEGIQKLVFEEGSVPSLERLSLCFYDDPGQDAVVGIEKLGQLKEIEFFGDGIFESVVQNVTQMASSFKPPPRIVRDDKPDEENHGRIGSTI